MAQWTIESLRRKTVDYFKQLGIPSAQLDTQLLLSHVLGLTRMQLFMEFDRPLTPAEVDGIRALVKRRSKFEPIAYILGKRAFYDMELSVGPGVLIPRPETETLVERALALLKDEESPLIVDICTGSGCIPLALLKNHESARAIGCDISSDALGYAKKNAADLNLHQRIGLVKGDLLNAIPQRFSGEITLLTSNPPYLTQGEMDTLMADVRHEPSLALAAGADGLDFYRRLAKNGQTYLKSGGHLLLEIGWEQGKAVEGLLQSAGWQNIQTLKDLAGKDRVVEAQKP